MFIYFIIALSATLVGSTVGIGGGIIIKPMMQATSELSLNNINIISSICVFTMALTNLISRKKNNNMYKVDNISYLIFGSIVGGVLGNKLFKIITLSSMNETLIEKFQILLLIVLLLIVLFKNKITVFPKYKVNKINIFIVGLFLSICGSFLGIGGGPINVAVLMIVFKMDIKKSIFISLVMIFFSQGSNVMIYAFTKSHIENDLTPLFVMIPSAIVGGILGNVITKKIDTNRVIILFNIVVCLLILLNIYNYFSV